MQEVEKNNHQHFNILVFDHGAVNHCQTDGGEAKLHMQPWQRRSWHIHPEGAVNFPGAKPHFWSKLERLLQRALDKLCPKVWYSEGREWTIASLNPQG